ncbi:unnamed protein product, partial [Meganyctiphanes norvegica]
NISYVNGKYQILRPEKSEDAGDGGEGATVASQGDNQSSNTSRVLGTVKGYTKFRLNPIDISQEIPVLYPVAGNLGPPRPGSGALTGASKGFARFKSSLGPHNTEKAQSVNEGNTPVTDEGFLGRVGTLRGLKKFKGQLSDGHNASPDQPNNLGTDVNSKGFVKTLQGIGCFRSTLNKETNAHPDELTNPGGGAANHQGFVKTLKGIGRFKSALRKPNDDDEDISKDAETFNSKNGTNDQQGTTEDGQVKSGTKKKKKKKKGKKGGKRSSIKSIPEDGTDDDEEDGEEEEEDPEAVLEKLKSSIALKLFKEFAKTEFLKENPKFKLFDDLNDSKTDSPKTSS